MPFQMGFFRFWREMAPKTGPGKGGFLCRFASKAPPRTVPKRIRGANSISYRFCIDFGPHFGPFSMTFDAVVGTCFVDLKLAPPPNHGKLFAGFSRVRRLRSASTMIFEVHFGIGFSSFL